MRFLISNLILPLPIFWILIVLTLILYKKRKKTSQITFRIALLWLFIISTPFIPDMLIKNLETQHSPVSNEILNNLKDSVNILVLGGSHIDDEILPANSQLSESSLARLVEGIRIHNQLKYSTLITSGYLKTSNISNAKVQADAALSLGIDSTSIRIQETPTNTWQEALIYKQTFGDSSKLILVTSAAHLPRAMMLFKKAGLNPIAAPADYLVKSRKKWFFFFWIPSSGNIEKMESAIHEYVGMAWYMLKGK